MYGNDTTAGGALATTGSAFVLANQVLLGVVLVLAGAAILTIFGVMRHRLSKEAE